MDWRINSGQLQCRTSLIRCILAVTSSHFSRMSVNTIHAQKPFRSTSPFRVTTSFELCSLPGHETLQLYQQTAVCFLNCGNTVEKSLLLDKYGYVVVISPPPHTHTQLGGGGDIGTKEPNAVFCSVMFKDLFKKKKRINEAFFKLLVKNTNIDIDCAPSFTLHTLLDVWPNNPYCGNVPLSAVGGSMKSQLWRLPLFVRCWPHISVHGMCAVLSTGQRVKHEKQYFSL